jgi:hypothetical protein
MDRVIKFAGFHTVTYNSKRYLQGFNLLISVIEPPVTRVT